MNWNHKAINYLPLPDQVMTEKQLRKILHEPPTDPK